MSLLPALQAQAEMCTLDLHTPLASLKRASSLPGKLEHAIFMGMLSQNMARKQGGRGQACGCPMLCLQRVLPSRMAPVRQRVVPGHWVGSFPCGFIYTPRRHVIWTRVGPAV